jgi:hypothetical protein
MTRWTKLVGLGLALAVVASIAVAVRPVLAQEPTATPQPGSGTTVLGKGLGWLSGFARGWVQMFDAVAEALKLSPTQLFEQLHSGKTIEEIAKDQGVDLSAVEQAIQKGRIEAMKAAIQQAVKDGKLTQEQADWLLEGLEKGYIPGGRGIGCGMRFGRGWGGGGRAPERGLWGGMGRFFGRGAPWGPAPQGQGGQSGGQS